jgi:hypothetical protein
VWWIKNEEEISRYKNSLFGAVIVFFTNSLEYSLSHRTRKNTRVKGIHTHTEHRLKTK